jgi:hypothetical protein
MCGKSNHPKIHRSFSASHKHRASTTSAISGAFDHDASHLCESSCQEIIIRSSLLPELLSEQAGGIRIARIQHSRLQDLKLALYQYARKSVCPEMQASTARRNVRHETQYDNQISPC